MEFPCSHACSVILFLGRAVPEFVPQFVLIVGYLTTYSSNIPPIDTAELFPSFSCTAPRARNSRVRPKKIVIKLAKEGVLRSGEKECWMGT
jgi:hypothetical protein